MIDTYQQDQFEDLSDDSINAEHEPNSDINKEKN